MTEREAALADALRRIAPEAHRLLHRRKYSFEDCPHANCAAAREALGDV